LCLESRNVKVERKTFSKFFLHLVSFITPYKKNFNQFFYIIQRKEWKYSVRHLNMCGNISRIGKVENVDFVSTLLDFVVREFSRVILTKRERNGGAKRKHCRRCRRDC